MNEHLEPAEALTRIFMGEELPEAKEELFAFLAQLTRLFTNTAGHAMAEAVRLGERPACRGKGCNWCCYDVAIITPLELAFILEALKQKPQAERVQIKKRAARWMTVHQKEDSMVPRSTPNFSQQELLRAEAQVAKSVMTSMRHNTPCPFLADGLCSIYAARPFACRGHHSLNQSASECKDKNLGKTGVKSINLTPLMIEVQRQMGANGVPVFPHGELVEMVVNTLLFQKDQEMFDAVFPVASDETKE